MLSFPQSTPPARVVTLVAAKLISVIVLANRFKLFATVTVVEGQDVGEKEVAAWP